MRPEAARNRRINARCRHLLDVTCSPRRFALTFSCRDQHRPRFVFESSLEHDQRRRHGLLRDATTTSSRASRVVRAFLRLLTHCWQPLSSPLRRAPIHRCAALGAVGISPLLSADASVSARDWGGRLPSHHTQQRSERLFPVQRTGHRTLTHHRRRRHYTHRAAAAWRGARGGLLLSGHAPRPADCVSERLD